MRKHRSNTHGSSVSGTAHVSLLTAMQEDMPAGEGEEEGGDFSMTNPLAASANMGTIRELIRAEISHQMGANIRDSAGTGGSSVSSPLVGGQGDVEGGGGGVEMISSSSSSSSFTKGATSSVDSAAGSPGAAGALDDPNYVPMYKKLGLEEFLFALDTPPQQLRRRVFNAIDTYAKREMGVIHRQSFAANQSELDKKHVEDILEIRKFASVWLAHHKFYHTHIRFSLELDVYFVLAAHNYNVKEVAQDREAEGEREAGHHEIFRGIIDDRVKSVGKVIFVALTQILVPILVLIDVFSGKEDEYDCMNTNNNLFDDDHVFCKVDEVASRSLCRWGQWGNDLNNRTMILKCVVFIFIGYVSVYGFYRWKGYTQSLYFEHVSLVYFDTCKPFFIQLGLIVNAFVTITVVGITALVLLHTDTLLEMILRSVALFFVTELDNALVSAEDEEQYVLRMERWMNLTWVNWTTDVKKWRKTRKHIRKGFRRKPSLAAKRLAAFFSSWVFQSFIVALLIANFFLPGYLFMCY